MDPVRIQEAQKHTDPTDPDPQHGLQQNKALPDAHLLEEGEDVVRKVLVLEAGLAIKNPPKKTHPKKTTQKTYLKNIKKTLNMGKLIKKNNKKNKKKPKKPLGWVFFIKPGFFPTLP
jgi:hypothetical protein